MSTNNRKNSYSGANHKLHLAVLAALPLMALASFNATGAECAYNEGEDVTCVNGNTYFISNVDADVSRHPTGRLTAADDIDGSTVTINQNTTITGTQYLSHSSGTTTGTVGIFILNGEDTEPLTLGTSGDPTLGALPVNLQANTYINEGVHVINNGTIHLENANSITLSTDDRGDLQNAGIYMDGSNNIITNNGDITVQGANLGVTRWGVIMTGDDANNENPTVNNTGTISVLTGYNGVVDKIQGAVVLKESIINGVVNNYEDGVIRAGVYGSPATVTNKFLLGVYADDNAQTVTVNNWGEIKVDTATSVIHADGTLGNATANAAIYLRSFDAIINNYDGGTITGDVITRDTTHDLVLTNAGLIDGYVVRQVRKDNLSGYNTHDNAGVLETGYTTYKPVIKQGGGNAGATTNAEYAAISGYITGNFNVVAYRPTGVVPTHDFNIQPVIDGATVHAGDVYKLTGGNLLLDSTNLVITNHVINTSPLVTWSANAVNGQALSITVDSINSAATVAGVTQQSAAAIDGLLTANSTLGGTVQGLTTAAQLEKAGQQLRPEANNASMQATMAAVDHVSSVIGTHQDETRTASNGNSGVSTGEAAQGVGFWMQGFGFKGDQSKRDSIDGYTANTGGFVLGGDTLVGNGDFRVGGAVAYASTGIDGDGATSANRTDVDSYQGSLYGSYNAGAWYVDAALGYGRHQYDTKRYVALAGASVTGSHDANQYLAKIGAGYPMQMGKVTITPMATMTYVNLDQDGYTEEDGSHSGAALTVADTQTNSFRSGLGAKISVPLSEGSMKTAVEARAMWNHEFADTNQDIAAVFAGGTSFTTAGVNQARDSANLGLGLNLSTANRQNLSVNYDAEVKSDYVGHTASFKFRYDF